MNEAPAGELYIIWLGQGEEGGERSRRQESERKMTCLPPLLRKGCPLGSICPGIT